KDWRAWMSKYLPGEDVRRPSFAYSYNSSAALITGAQTGGQRSLAREYHAPGDEPARPRAADAAAGNQGQHQSDRLFGGPAVAAGAVRRQAWGAFRGFGLRRVRRNVHPPTRVESPPLVLASKITHLPQ